MFAEPSKRLLQFLNGLLLAAHLPYLLLFLYVFPQSDDYFFAYHLQHTGIFSFVQEMYLTWTGRYLSMFLGVLQSYFITMPEVYSISLAFLFLVFFGSIFYFVKTLLASHQSASFVLFTSLSVSFVQLQISPDLMELLYWFPSASAYLLSMSLSWVLLAMMIKLYRQPYFSWKLSIGIAVGGWAMPALLEMNIPMLLAWSISPLVLMRKLTQKQKRNLWITFIWILLSSILVIMAPGNALRMKVEATTHEGVNFIVTNSKAILSLGVYVFQKPALLMLGLLFLLHLNPQFLKNSPLFKRSPWLILGASILLLWFALLPVTYSLQIMPSGRIFNMMAFWFLLLVMINLLVFKAHFARSFPEIKSKSAVQLTFIIPVFLTLWMSFSAFGISNPRNFFNGTSTHSLNFGNNSSEALYVLLFEAKATQKQWNQYQERLEKAKGSDTLWFDALPSGSRLLLLRDAEVYRGKWFQSLESKYYQIDSLYLNPTSNVR